MKTGLAIGLCSLAIGCTTEAERPAPGPGRFDLRAAMDTSGDVDPVGVAISPDGQRFVFDEARGLFRLDGDRAVSVVPMSAMPDPGPAVRIRPPFTDLVALATDVFALTAIGDGYLLDTSAMTLKQHFCYEPGEFPVEELVQRTDALAYDVATDRLYAQPVTTTLDGELRSSQVAAYDRASGIDIEWRVTEDDIAATGMIWLSEVGLVLGQGSRLSRFDMGTGQAILIADLAQLEVRSIDGLALDTATNALVVVDKKTDMMFDIDLSIIGL